MEPLVYQGTLGRKGGYCVLGVRWSDSVHGDARRARAKWAFSANGLGSPNGAGRIARRELRAVEERDVKWLVTSEESETRKKSIDPKEALATQPDQLRPMIQKALNASLGRQQFQHHIKEHRLYDGRRRISLLGHTNTWPICKNITFLYDEFQMELCPIFGKSKNKEESE
jgi:hypothetical protein